MPAGGGAWTLVKGLRKEGQKLPSRCIKEAAQPNTFHMAPKGTATTQNCSYQTVVLAELPPSATIRRKAKQRSSRPGLCRRMSPESPCNMANVFKNTRAHSAATAKAISPQKERSASLNQNHYKQEYNVSKLASKNRLVQLCTT